jgi:hypothetical protein
VHNPGRQCVTVTWCLVIADHPLPLLVAPCTQPSPPVAAYAS